MHAWSNMLPSAQDKRKYSKNNQPDKTCQRQVMILEWDSALGQHLWENEVCAANFNNERFKFLTIASNSFHLSLLKASFNKITWPVLCKQKQLVFTLKCCLQTTGSRYSSLDILTSQHFSPYHKRKRRIGITLRKEHFRHWAKFWKTESRTCVSRSDYYKAIRTSHLNVR